MLPKNISSGAADGTGGGLSSQDLADLVAAAALEHKALEPVLLNLEGLSPSPISDWFFIASAQNPRQVSAIAEKIITRAREAGYRPLGVEGLNTAGSRWVLVDLGWVVAHIFSPETRALYDLESLWSGASRRNLTNERPMATDRS